MTSSKEVGCEAESCGQEFPYFRCEVLDGSFRFEVVHRVGQDQVKEQKIHRDIGQRFPIQIISTCVMERLKLSYLFFHLNGRIDLFPTTKRAATLLTTHRTTTEYMTPLTHILRS